MNIAFIILAIVAGTGLGTTATYVTLKKKQAVQQEDRKKEIAKQEEELQKIKKEISKAEVKVQEAEVEAKRKSVEIIEEAKKEEKQRRQQISVLEERLLKKEETFDKKIEDLEKKQENVRNQEQKIQEKEEEVAKVKEDAVKKLESIAGLSKDEAQKQLLEKVEQDSREILVKRYQQLEEEVKENAEKKAKNIIVNAIQRYAAEVAAESTATVISLPSDDMKGRVIGREGRNINSFERLTGVDVVIDDTPGSILISGFDLVRRYVAKRALEYLIEDGRIHPARIEEMVLKAKKEVNTLIKEFGEKAVMELGVTGLHPDLVKIVGRLRFRTSYGQNILKHSKEVAYIAQMLASELGADEQIAKTAAFLHDIGKAVDHEIEGPHALIGRDILKKYNVNPKVIQAVAAHHEDEKPEALEDFIVQAADAISGARPGARRDSLEAYIQRLKDLENSASSFPGVSEVYAIQAGREIRVFVKPDEVDDVAATKMSADIAHKIEEELSYPGQIKVHVIRETRAVEYAK